MRQQRERIVRAVRPNMGVAARYRRALLGLIREMSESVESLLLSQRKRDAPVMAEDASPASRIHGVVEGLSLEWQKRFDESADRIARDFVHRQSQSTYRAMREALRSAGWTITLHVTPALRDVMDAALIENVGLIRSIPSDYFAQIQGIVMRNYQSGEGPSELAREIRARFGIASRRAHTIARDQTSKLNSVVERTRQKQMGIEEAVWMHSHAGKEPRRTHLRMDGKRYKIDHGMYDSAEKKWIFPGQLINCRCVCRAVVPWISE